MPKEVDDDVPIYFSPGDDDDGSQEIPQEVDRKTLLEDEPPRQWEPYMPAKTLEQAAKEADKRGEQKIKGMKNQSGISQQMTPVKSSKEDSTDKSSTLSAVAPQQEQSMTLEKFLKMSGRFLKANALEPEESAPVAQPKGPSPRTRKQIRVLTVVACLNFFAIGFWIGSFVFPNNRVVTGLLVDTPKTQAGHVRGDSSVANVVTALDPVVVNIDTRVRPPQPTPVPYRSTQKFFQPPTYVLPRNAHVQAQGSGLIISTDGHILTNNHVVAPGAEIRVTLSDHREFPGRVVGRDAYSDLAVIKISANNLPVARFADMRKVRVGDWAIVMGSPHGFDHTVTVGVVSALNRVVGDFNHHIPMIQTDAAIGPGNSGGPVVDMDGEVIGIACAAANRGTIGINFALPSNTVSEVTKHLIEEGSIPRPFLGIFMEDIDPNRKRAQTLPGNPIMVVVGRIVAGGPAEKAGILQNDIILSVNGRAVKSSDAVRAVLAKLKPGDTMDFRIHRIAPPCDLDKKVILEKYPDIY